LVVIAPAAIGIAAASLYPVPSRIEMIEAVRNATNEANHRSSLLLARYYDDHPELAPAGEANAATEFATRSLAVQTEVERRIAPLLDRYDAQLEQQQELASRLRFLSPATAVADAMNQLAGTSSERYRDFTAQVRRFHREWQAWFAPHIFKRAMLHSDDVARLPRFRYQPWSDGGRVLADLAGLAIVAAVVAGLAVWQLRRYAIVG
ncbi:MAG TPA: DUF3526 domain-containing protein, partial [Bryobacteraceae bacterium]|nr:DUF3526 domain-containing protein [Bryobacteraceae bacterium]